MLGIEVQNDGGLLFLLAVAGLLLFAGGLHLLPRLGGAGRALASVATRAPGLGDPPSMRKVYRRGILPRRETFSQSGQRMRSSSAGLHSPSNRAEIESMAMSVPDNLNRRITTRG